MCFDKALKFNKNNKVNLNGFTAPLSIGRISSSFWIRPAANGGSMELIGNVISGGVLDNGFILEGNTGFSFEINNSMSYPQSRASYSGTWDVAITDWAFVVFNWDLITTPYTSANFEVWLNGVLQVGTWNDLTPSNPVLIYDTDMGWQTINPFGRFMGDLDDLALYSDFLTPSEIATLYDSGLGCIKPNTISSNALYFNMNSYYNLNPNVMLEFNSGNPMGFLQNFNGRQNIQDEAWFVHTDALHIFDLNCIVCDGDNSNTDPCVVPNPNVGPDRNVCATCDPSGTNGFMDVVLTVLSVVDGGSIAMISYIDNSFCECLCQGLHQYVYNAPETINAYLNRWATDINTILAGSGVVANVIADTITFTFDLARTFGFCCVEIQLAGINVIGSDPGMTFTVNGPLCCTTSTTVPLVAGNPFPCRGLWTLVTAPSPCDVNIVIDDPADFTTFATGVNCTGLTRFNWEVTCDCPGGPGVRQDDLDLTVYGQVTQPFAGFDQQICGLSTTLTGTLPNLLNSETVLWSLETPAPGSALFSTATNNSTIVTVSAPGVYTFAYEINSPCQFSGNFGHGVDALTVLFNITPTTTAQAGLDAEVCTLNYTLNGNLAGAFPQVGTWTVTAQPFGSAYVFDNVNLNTATITVNTVGIYELTWTIDNPGCGSSSDLMFLTIDPSFVTTANAGPDFTICAIVTMTMAGNAPTPPETGLWTIISIPALATASFVDATDPLSVVNFGGINPIGLYTFRWTISNNMCGLSDFDEVTVDVISSAIVTANAGPDFTICDNATITLAANAPAGGETGLWTVISQPGFSTVIFTDDTAFNTDVSVNILGFYTFEWTITNDTCLNTSSDQITFEVVSSNVTQANAGIDQSICEGDIITLAGNAPAGGETGLWTVISQPGFSTVIFTDDTLFNTTATADLVGTYVFEWTLTNTLCSSTSSDQMQIIVNMYPATPDAGPDVNGTWCGVGGGVYLQGVAVIGGYWSIVSGGTGLFLNNITFAIDPNDPLAFFVYDFDNTYVLQWCVDSPQGCTSCDQVTMTSEAKVIANAGPDQSVSFNIPFTLFPLVANNAGPGVGTWTIVSGLGTFVSTGTTSSNLETDTFQTAMIVGSTIVLQWSIVDACGSSLDSVTLNVIL